MRLKLQLPAKAGGLRISECEAVRLVTLTANDFQELLNCPKRDARWGAEPQYYEQQGERIYRGVLILAEGREDGVFAYDAGEHFAYLPNVRVMVDSILEQAVERIIKEGTENTNEGNWCYYFSELYEQMDLVVEPGNGIDTMILEKLEQRPEAADVVLTDECFDVCYYRTETRTDSEGNDYDVEVPYNYYICKVKLENFDLSHVPVYIMDEGTLSLYAVYMATLGNREDLFPGSGYVDKYTKPPTTYDIPPSALEDETFAALITEAEKYIGYPYVWGGSNPNTSFDCSGFVSWVLTQSGVCNTGRLGAQGLYNISTPVSSANARPGDLIFFVGTYDTPGVSHVGIYVGGGKMLHCGDPIQYADINTSYWQSHFYAFGRPPYN